ncbi:hypothetical protein JL720_13178 [Aureococcus anophagefferens]|nr:hypothetical protein JL720_13178 [Aureococcus anophagefferens]
MASLEERVVAWLREEKVKLWLAPYDDDGALTATASTYAAALDEADVAAVAATLRDLRRRAVEKLAAKRRRTVRGAGAAGEPFEVALDGGTAGADARAVLAAAGGYDGRVRVIAGGRALVDGATLAAQGWPSDAERAGRRCAILIASRRRRARFVPRHALLGDGARLDDAERRLAAAERSLARRFDDRYEGRGVAARARAARSPRRSCPRCGARAPAACRGADASALAADGACLLAALRHDAAALAPLEALRARAAALAALRRRGRRAKAAAAILDAADRRGAKRKEAPIVAGGGATSDGSFVDARLDRSAASARRRVRARGAQTVRQQLERRGGGPAAGRGARRRGEARGAARARRGPRRRRGRARACDGDVDHAAIRLASGWRPPPAATPAPAPAPVPAPPLPPAPPRGPRPPMDAELEAAHRLVEAELGGALEDEDADAIDGADLAYETALLESLRSES